MGVLNFLRSLVGGQPVPVAAVAPESAVAESNNPPPWDGPFNQYPYRWGVPHDVPLTGTGLIAAGPDRWSAEWLDAMRKAARDLAESNAFAICAIDNLENFLVGDGFKYTVSTKDKASQALVAAAQDVIDEFLERTVWAEWELELVRRRSRDGEYFLRYFPDGGFLDVRIIEPEWVKNPDHAGDEWVLGRKLDPEDKGGEPVAYWVVYPGEAGVEIPAGEILHVKANVDCNAPRGLSDFFATEDSLSGISRLLRNMRDGEALRAAVAGFWEYENATAAAVAAHVQQTKDAIQPRGNAANPITGKTDNFQKIAPASIIHVPKGKKFTPPPTSPATSSQVQVEAACLRSIAVRWNMPENMISADASNNNYASILVAGAPFSRSVRKGQGSCKRHWVAVLWQVLRVAAEAGRIVGPTGAATWQQAYSLLSIQAEPPAPEMANELEQSQVDGADMAAGVMSKQTRAMRRGLDWEQEKKNLAEEPKPEAPAGPAPGMFGPATESLSPQPPSALDLARAFLQAKAEMANQANPHQDTPPV